MLYTALPVSVPHPSQVDSYVAHERQHSKFAGPVLSDVRLSILLEHFVIDEQLFSYMLGFPARLISQLLIYMTSSTVVLKDIQPNALSVQHGKAELLHLSDC